MEKKPFRVEAGAGLPGHSHPETDHPLLPEGHVVMLDDIAVQHHRAHGLALVPVPPAGNKTDNERHFNTWTGEFEDGVIDHDEDGDAPSYIPPDAF